MFILYARRIRNISSGKGRRGVGKKMLRAWIWQDEVGWWKGYEQRCSCGGISIDCSRNYTDHKSDSPAIDNLFSSLPLYHPEVWVY